MTSLKSMILAHGAASAAGYGANVLIVVHDEEQAAGMRRAVEEAADGLGLALPLRVEVRVSPATQRPWSTVNWQPRAASLFYSGHEDDMKSAKRADEVLRRYFDIFEK